MSNIREATRKICLKVRSVIASPVFFWCVFAYFVLSAVWLALTALYPMAFDEEVHYGITQLYTHQWSPIIAHQPAGSFSFGPLAVDPSFLFHYLMSFLLRFIELFTQDQTIQVIFLRFIDVAFVAAALVFYRRLLLRIGASKFLANVAIALFVLVPDVPFLAAQINYDNLLILLVPIVLLLALRLARSWRKGLWDSRVLLMWLIAALAASMVKYAFLPILAAVFVFLLIVLIKSLRRQKLEWRKLMPDFNKIKWPTKAWLVALVVVLGGLFVHSYGVNVVKYHAIMPDCGQVLTPAQCKNFGPWARDHRFKQQLSSSFSPHLTSFTASWFQGMLKRSVFSIASKKTGYHNPSPLPVIKWLIAVLAFGGAVLLVVFWRRVFWGQTALQLLAFVIIIYCLALFIDTYRMYSKVGGTVAINGRYLFPILPLTFLIYGRAFGAFFRKFKMQMALPVTGGLVLLTMLLQGGGATAWVRQSQDTWDWPNQTVRDVNRGARNVLKAFIPGADGAP